VSSARSSADADPVSAALDRAAAHVLDAVLEVAASNPVVLIDGRSGSGKTSLARALVARWPLRGRVQLVSLDSLYPGWDGLADGVETARELILRPHARGLIGIWQRWDWESSEPAEAHAVDPSLPLIVEGSGLLTAATAKLGDVRVWLEQEERHLARDEPARRASLVFAIP
jgi:hypothetical protein